MLHHINYFADKEIEENSIVKSSNMESSFSLKDTSEEDLIILL